MGETNVTEQDWQQTPVVVQRAFVAALEQIRTVTDTANKLGQELQELKEKDTKLDGALAFLAAQARMRSRTAKQAVFLCDMPSTRVAKIAYGLSKIGWQVILLHRHEPIFDPTQCFGSVHKYGDANEALLLSCLYAPAAYHCFSSWGFEVAKLVTRLRPGPIVFDDYDMFAGGLQPEFAKEAADKIADEKFCLENVDGICNRSLTMQMPKKHLQYKIRGKPIFFPEYCWNRGSENGFRLRPKRKDGIHMVFVGDCGARFFDDPEKIGCCDKEFIDAVTARGLHFHIYPFYDFKQSFADAMRDYIQLANENRYFHIHRPVPCDQLISEISQYHFGIHAHGERVMTHGSWAYTPLAFQYHMNNKMFDYMDAGLVPVMFVGRMVNWFIRRGGAGLVMSREQVLSNLDVFFDAPRRVAFERNVIVARDNLAVARQAKRLAALYEHVSSNNFSA